MVHFRLVLSAHCFSVPSISTNSSRTSYGLTGFPSSMISFFLLRAELTVDLRSSFVGSLSEFSSLSIELSISARSLLILLYEVPFALVHPLRTRPFEDCHFDGGIE